MILQSCSGKWKRRMERKEGRKKKKKERGENCTNSIGKNLFIFSHIFIPSSEPLTWELRFSEYITIHLYLYVIYKKNNKLLTSWNNMTNNCRKQIWIATGYKQMRGLDESNQTTMRLIQKNLEYFSFKREYTENTKKILNY